MKLYVNNKFIPTGVLKSEMNLEESLLFSTQFSIFVGVHFCMAFTFDNSHQ
jgi:hypothetical protein